MAPYRGSIPTRQAAHHMVPLAIVLVTCLGALPAHAQPPRGPLRAALAPPLAVLSHEFGRITNVRELSDGRVLVADGIDKQIVIADFATQRVAQVGSVGNGPGEYVNAGVLHPLGGDTTLSMDAQTRRWLMLVGDRVAMTIPPDHPAVVATKGAFAASTRGGQLVTAFYEPLMPGIREIGVADSMVIAIASFATGRLDTVAAARRIHQTYTGFDVPGARPFYFTSRQAFAAGEDFDIAPNGWLAVARLDPYRVDWRAPDGRVVRGQPIPYDAVRMNEKEKAFYRQRFANQLNGPRAFPTELSASQREAVRAGMTRQYNDFPTVMPPFTQPAIVAMSDDEAFIWRTPSVEDRGYVFDVVDHHGRLVARLHMERGERIIGTGRHCVYVAAEDEDGLDHLRKHVWP